ENSFALCDYLSSVGGKDETSLTNNILKRCLTNQLASSFSFKGKGVKKPFVDLSLKSVVVEPGEYFNGRVVLTGISAPKRNNRSFRMQLDEEHHIGISPLKHLDNLGSLLVKQLLDNFVKHSETLYGREFLVYNLHMLTHSSEDADVYGSLDNVPSFPFENYLGQLKKLVRCPNNPLQQVCRRLSEINTLETRINLSDDIFTSQGLKLVHNLGPVPELLVKDILGTNLCLTTHLSRVN
ncbi:hypothetical protein ILUMI_07058, partial [Ignelater luminosus]